MKLLIVEDEHKAAAYLSRGLEENGFVVDVAHRGEDGAHLARTGAYDAIILDVMLPGRDGWSIITELRQLQIETPVLFLTARDAIHDRVKGLELGADDYLVKPASMVVLVARVRALLRRPRRRVEWPRVGDLRLDPVRRRCLVGDTPVDLTPTEFRLLATIAGYPGRVYSRFELINRVQGTDFEGYERTIDAHVKNLRRKLEPDPADPRYVQTVHGIGYRLGVARG